MITMLAGRGLPAETLDALVTRADGVPLFVEELTKAVVEPGALPGVEAIPATLADSLMARLDRLSTAKEVAQRAAVLGREFAYPLLAAVGDLEEAALRQGLERLVEAEIVFVRGEPPDATYTFKHALVQEAAYESLLKRTRQQLHGRVVDVLTRNAATEPEQLARHAEAAGRIDEAIASYRRASEQAQAHSAFEESIRHLRRAIALISAQPEGGERDAREVPLQFALGDAVSAARGYTHPEVQAAFERARSLCEAVGDAHGVGWALAGLAEYLMACGLVERAGVFATRVLEIAEQTHDTDLALRGRIDLGATELYEGKFTSSLAHLSAARALYDPGRQYLTDSGFTINDPDVLALSYSSWGLSLLGWPDRALACTHEAVALARRIDRPFSLATALFYETGGYWLRRDASAQRERAAEAIVLSEAHVFPFWLGLARTFHAAARAAAGELAAVADLLPGLAEGGGTGNRLGAAGLFGILGGAYLSAGQLAQARGAVETGLAFAAQTGQHFMDAELHRLQGEIALADGGLPAEAEATFQRALEVARAQEARSLELRTATSLARLWRDQGKGREARALLAPVHGWFTEGFDTCDLIEAKALLESLA
jgi:tetratricopeptide (TPR) repeat protein